MDNEKKRECDFVLTEDVINEESKDEESKDEVPKEKSLDDLDENLDLKNLERDLENLEAAVLLYKQACNEEELKEADGEQT